MSETFTTNNKTFGTYIKIKRSERGVRLRDLSAALGDMSVSYLSDIIRGRRNAPDKKHLDIIADVLHLNFDERSEMFDLAGLSRGEIAPDITDYVMQEDIPELRAVLRKAKDKNLGDDFWKKVNVLIENNNPSQGRTEQMPVSDNYIRDIIREVIKESAQRKTLTAYSTESKTQH